MSSLPLVLMVYFPQSWKIYKEQKEVGDDVCFREIIKSSTLSSNDVVVFDRGLKKRSTFKEFWEQDIYFVTRINPTQRYKEFANIGFSKSDEETTDRFTLKKDTQIYLYGGQGQLCQVPIRLIIYTNQQTKEDFYFITNIYDLKAIEISQIYAMRWDIEVFFKFLKQELNLKHFLSRNENGIKVGLYITMITVVMLLIYKRENQLQGYKIMKLNFVLELQLEIIKLIVKWTGGNPDLVDKYPLTKGFGQ